MSAHLIRISQQCDEGSACGTIATHRLRSFRNVVLGSFCQVHALAALERELEAEELTAQRIVEVMDLSRRTVYP